MKAGRRAGILDRMGMRMGGKTPEAVEPDVDEDDIDAGEDLFVLLCEVLKAASPAQQLEIGNTFQRVATGGVSPPEAWQALSPEVRALFAEGANAWDEALLADDP